MPNYFEIGPVVFNKKIVKAFPFGCHDNKNSAWNGISLNNFERGSPKNYSCEFW